ncbi:DNA topoisomerase IB [Bizionia myxarmorum]|uniref:DNA topoisomerase n=1 Tax=Bizionia myxarmorum TaxID=291186 RepID=A0A5D0R464_9FLAO|nr:DNA topoisomerase IB [Bizionia myxarmorum]TYB75839.1 DNA topoisomerase IB [Bizionia myxarmorum]
MNSAKQNLKLLIQHPEEVISQYDLVYVNQDHLSIQRQKCGKGFTYRLKSKPIDKAKHLTRIKSLVIPPAWKNVEICLLSNGHIQAVGIDDKNRKQYIYHANWLKIRNQTKFYKMTAFGAQLPKIREQVDKDLDQKGWPKSKIIALVIRLMEETHIRIGNEQYAKRNQSYGLSTFKKRHVKMHDKVLKFEFTGKKGVKHAITLKNKKLIKLISKCEEIPGWDLFKYQDDSGEKHSIESDMINKYVQAISDEIFTAKDFRTWGASIVFLEMLTELDIVETEKELDKNIVNALDTTAKALGNTRSVCRDYYVHPHLVDSYKKGSLTKSFKKIKENTENTDFLSSTEQEFLKIIKNYKPDN